MQRVWGVFYSPIQHLWNEWGTTAVIEVQWWKVIGRKKWGRGGGKERQQKLQKKYRLMCFTLEPFIRHSINVICLALLPLAVATAAASPERKEAPHVGSRGIVRIFEVSVTKCHCSAVFWTDFPKWPKQISVIHGSSEALHGRHVIYASIADGLGIAMHSVVIDRNNIFAWLGAGMGLVRRLFQSHFSQVARIFGIRLLFQDSHNNIDIWCF